MPASSVTSHPKGTPKPVSNHFDFADVSCSAREKSQPRNGAGEIFITAAAEIGRETVSATNRVGRVRLTRGNVGGSRRPGNKTPETGLPGWGTWIRTKINGVRVLKGHNMQVPLDITFRNSEPSEAIRSEVEKQAKRLEKFHDRITSCHVTVIAPTMKRRHGDLFKIDIRVAMPQHTDILVSKAHGDAPEHEHVMVAIKDAFAAAQRQIEDAAREKRG